MRPTILILIIITVTLVGCKKDKDEITNSDLLTEKIWIHDNDMIDMNENLEPDDEMGPQKNISFDFQNNGSLIYTRDQVVHQLTWTFENNESSIRIIGIMDSLTIPYITESSRSILQLDEDNLIFYVMSTVNNPETGTFMIHKHE